MSATLSLLFLLLPVGAVAWIIWSFRRKVGQKEARTQERVVALMGAAQTTGPKPRPAPANTAAAARATTGMAAGPALAATRRERFLSQPETLVYYLLRTGLPGYEVFPRVSLVAVVELAAGRRPVEQPGAHDLDFVVCDKSMRVVAAVQLEGRPGGPAGAWVEQNLAAAGVRLVRINPAALPKREQVGALILGGAG